MNKYIKFLIRITTTFLLILLLLKKVEITYILNILVLINPFFFFLASFLYIFSSYISTLRWRIFLPSKEISISKLFSLYLIGSFFNNVLPGIIGGDVVKIFMIKEKTGLKQALASVFIERYIGLCVLLMIGFVFFCLFYTELPKQSLVWIVPVIFLCFAVVTALPMFFRKIKFFKEFRNYIFSFSRKKFFQAFAYSFFIQFTVIFSVYIIFLGFGISVSFFELCIFLPIIILISMLPISVSGVGVREWCFVLFFGKSFGEAQVVAVSFLWFFSQVFASLIGVIEYLRFKKFLNIKRE